MGRNKVVYNDELIMDLIKLFIEEKNHHGILKYRELYEYSTELYNLGKINIKLSDDFWRKEGRQGRELVDKLNETYNDINYINKIDAIEVVNTEEVVKRYISKDTKDFARMIHQLRINEVYAKKYQKALKINKNYEVEIKALEYKVKELTKQKIQLEKALFSLFSSSKSESSVKNLLNTGKSRSNYVDELFVNIFNDEVEIYESLLRKFTNSAANHDSQKDKRVTNLVNLYKNNK